MIADAKQWEYLRNRCMGFQWHIIQRKVLKSCALNKIIIPAAK